MQRNRFIAIFHLFSFWVLFT